MNLNIVYNGILVGFLARFLTLREDYRQYPSFPSGYLIHLTVGFIASALGAVAVPAILERDYVAVTFLALAAQQFREIRKMERGSLLALEDSELEPRGMAYIDGIAKTFEARNYFSLSVALLTTLAGHLLFPRLRYWALPLSALVGLAFLAFLRFASRGHLVKDIADVRPAKLSFRSVTDLYVDDIYVMNVGSAANRERILKKGLGAVITPRDDKAVITLANFGQRQAILHELGRTLGVQRFIKSRRDYGDERVAVFLVPIKKDQDQMVKVIRHVPLLESTRKPLDPRKEAQWREEGP